VPLIGERNGQPRMNTMGVMIESQMTLTAWYSVGGLAQHLDLDNICERDELSGSLSLDGFQMNTMQVISRNRIG